MSGGNHSASGARSNAEAMSVIECATVKAVTTSTSGRKRRNGITRQSRNSRWSVPSRMWKKPSSTNRQRRLMPARIEPDRSPDPPPARTPVRRRRAAEAQRRHHADAQPRQRRVGSRSPIGPTRSGTRTARPSGPGSRRAPCPAAAAVRSTCASAVSYDANDRSEGSEICVGDDPRRTEAACRLRRARCCRRSRVWRRRGRPVSARVEVEVGLVARREQDVPHRGERRAHEQAQPLPLGPQERVDGHVVRDLVRARPERQREHDAPRATSECARQRASSGGRSPLRRSVYWRPFRAECSSRSHTHHSWRCA